MKQIIKQLKQKKKEGKTFAYLSVKDKYNTIKKLREKGYICDLYSCGEIVVKL